LIVFSCAWSAFSAHFLNFGPWTVDVPPPVCSLLPVRSVDANWVASIFCRAASSSFSA
jgi:hypothetical protein